MFPAEVIPVFPFVSFTNVEGKEFCIARERVLHVETYQDKDGNLNPDRTFVNFASPNPSSKGPLHAVVDMPVNVFREACIKPAYEGTPRSE